MSLFGNSTGIAIWEMITVSFYRCDRLGFRVGFFHEQGVQKEGGPARILARHSLA